MNEEHTATGEPGRPGEERRAAGEPGRPRGGESTAAVHVLVVAAPGLTADRGLLRQVAEAECRALGVEGRLVVATGAASLWDVLSTAGKDESCALVVLHGPDPAVRPVQSRPGPHAPRTVWYDPGLPGATDVTPGSTHMSGRGVWGLAWAVRHTVHRLRHPAHRVPYGPAGDQWADLRLPSTPVSSAGSGGPGAERLSGVAHASDTAHLPATSDVSGIADTSVGPVPVVMLVHGGFWRSVWGADLMDAPAVDLTARGYATWNVEYRRPDHHGWQATTADVAAGLAALHDLATTDRRIDPRRVAVAGHSAGGQLALRLAADTGPSGLAFAVSLAGVVDLREGDRRRMGAGAVAAALGGSHEDVPWVYAAADPLSRLPLGVPHLVVQGRDDDLDLVDMARRYTAAARAAGDHVIHLEHPGDHFAVIDPATPIWAATVEELARHLHP